MDFCNPDEEVLQVNIERDDETFLFKEAFAFCYQILLPEGCIHYYTSFHLEIPLLYPYLLSWPVGGPPGIVGSCNPGHLETTRLKELNFIVALFISIDVYILALKVPCLSVLGDRASVLELSSS